MKRIITGFKVGASGLSFMFRQPKSLLSVVVFWGVLMLFGGLGLLLFTLFGDSENLFAGPTLLLVFIGMPLCFVMAGSISSLLLLEIIEQHETTGAISLSKALRDTIKDDLSKTLPIIIVWGILVFVVTLIQMLISLIWLGFASVFGFKADVPLDITNRSSNVLLKGVRVFMQFTLPAIAWERLSTTKAIKKSWEIIRSAWVEILGAIMFGNIVLLLVVAPLFALYYLYQGDVINDTWVMTILFVLLALGYSIGRLLQQIYVAYIYMWYMNWEKAIEEAGGRHLVPMLKDFPRPSLLDDRRDLLPTGD